MSDIDIGHPPSDASFFYVHLKSPANCQGFNFTFHLVWFKDQNQELGWEQNHWKRANVKWEDNQLQQKCERIGICRRQGWIICVWTACSACVLRIRCQPSTDLLSGLKQPASTHIRPNGGNLHRVLVAKKREPPSRWHFWWVCKYKIKLWQTFRILTKLFRKAKNLCILI